MRLIANRDSLYEIRWRIFGFQMKGQWATLDNAAKVPPENKPLVRQLTHRCREAQGFKI